MACNVLLSVGERSLCAECDAWLNDTEVVTRVVEHLSSPAPSTRRTTTPTAPKRKTRDTNAFRCHESCVAPVRMNLSALLDDEEPTFVMPVRMTTRASSAAQPPSVKEARLDAAAGKRRRAVASPLRMESLEEKVSPTKRHRTCE